MALTLWLGISFELLPIAALEDNKLTGFYV